MRVLYVGRRFDATRTVAVPLDYLCTDCGFRSKVVALGRGQGAAHDPFFLDTDADERASDAAFYAAHRSAREAVALVHCPRCGGLDLDAWWWFRIKAGVLLSAICVVFAAIAVAFAFSSQPGVGAIVGVTTPFLLGVVYSKIRWRYTTAESRVAFDPPCLAARRRLDLSAGTWFEESAQTRRARSRGGAR